ncbi:MAG TPA: DNA double-strand break repair nuclease NurA [Patescibacteria group bacterium]|nr:DNA double-strand break repair nuclease NurA [Patescibacteria group bacterium]
MSQVRDLFFDEFYAELEAVARDIEASPEDPSAPSALKEDVLHRWIPQVSDEEDRPEALISVDGGVQYSSFAYGGFVAVGRAVAITHRRGKNRSLTKHVKIHVQDVYDNRDRGFIPGYVRTIAEYRAAHDAALKVLDEGGVPVVLMDGSLYLARFPYAIREYSHHPGLLRELFNSMADLRCLSRDRGFPLAGVAKDSTVFYLHMQLLKDAARRAGLGRLDPLIQDASSPMDLRLRMDRWDQADKQSLEPFLDRRPLCDTLLVDSCAPAEGYTHPLLLAPSLYYGREDAPALYTRIKRSLPEETAEGIIGSMRHFFGCPGVSVIYWRPTRAARPFRVDLTASMLGHPEPWVSEAGNRFLESDADLGPLEGVLNHLAHWYCNDIEYNIPLKQADTLAHFDRALYSGKYEPFIVRRLEEAGMDIRGTRRSLRELNG